MQLLPNPHGTRPATVRSVPMPDAAAIDHRLPSFSSSAAPACRAHDHDSVQSLHKLKAASDLAVPVVPKKETGRICGRDGPIAWPDASRWGTPQGGSIDSPPKNPAETDPRAWGNLCAVCAEVDGDPALRNATETHMESSTRGGRSRGSRRRHVSWDGVNQ